jgi:AcrR family transcriptional regulator
VPRAGLTPDRVARAAADLADERGWEQLTLAAVADSLGVRQPSLYKHVASLAALRRMVSRLAVTELGERLMSAVAGRSGTDALQQLAAAYRRYAHERPGRYAASVVAPAPGDDEHARVGEAIIATIAAVLRGYHIGDGSADESVLHAIRALRAVLHGFVALEAAGGYALALDLDESYRRLVDGFDAALRRQAEQPRDADTPVGATTVRGAR